MRPLRLFKWILILVLLAAAICGIWIGAQGYGMYQEALDREKLEDKIRQIREETGFVPFEQLPKTYVDAVVAVEDHRFFSHGGIDWIAILRAVFNNLKAGEIVEGGSTITQQLARNLYFTQEETLKRKAAELFAALRLERDCGKEEILELYVNVIYFGEGYYGIGEASRGYFGKEPSQLTPEECMMLAGIPNAPSVYAPTVHPELARERQEQVESCMEEYGYLEKEAA